jgi:hypothetical protein
LIESASAVAIDDMFQGGNLDVFDGPAAQVPANTKNVVPASIGSTSVLGVRVVPQPGTAYDPYAYRPLGSDTTLGDVGDTVPPAAVAPLGTLASADGADAAEVPTGGDLVAVKPWSS